MATVVIMPKQGQSVESCIITEIRKNVGDKVSVGDVLFAYETDKASFEEESKAEGIVLACYFHEGDEVPCLTDVMVIGAEGEAVPEKASPQPEASPQPSPKGKGAVSGGNHSPLLQEGTGEAMSFASPRARRLAEEKGIDWRSLSGSGPGGRIIEQDVEAAVHTQGRLSGKARAMMAEGGLGAPAKGSGLAGMVRGCDLTAYPQPLPKGKGAASAASPQPSPKGKGAVSGSNQSPLLQEGKGEATLQEGMGEASLSYDDVPMTNMRKLIARAMYNALQNSAQLTHHLGADARRIQALRRQAKKAYEEGRIDANITINDLVCYAVIRALKQFPNVNSHCLGESLRIFRKVNLGLAVDTERGLMVPAVPAADDLDIIGLSKALKRVADDCKKGSINPDLLRPEAASFTVSNLGAYGVEIFTPIINVPQSAILGVNTIVPRPKDLGGGVYAFVPYIGLSLTYDHRSIDGGEATRFLKTIATEIEKLDITF
ncbi:MAG: 2-oxo acid dehydrogenase subunit E2 [Bacteroidaceae bacterium]|nr:2-oxo acid dehydrogenase subunit E2 [Bacteroidaceae bacterium]